jgi:glycoprotein-N-acetylgalactosamine 3-beta-galactosyltransferase
MSLPLPFWFSSHFPLEMARGARRPLAHFLGVSALLLAISVVALAAATDRDALVARLGLNHAALARVRVQPTSAADMARVRVLCWVNTFHGNHEKRLRTIQRTWGKKCDKLLFMSDVEDLSIPTVRIMAPPLHETLWQKHREIVRMLVREYTEGDFDWILKCDDDTFVIMENLKQLLLSSLVRNLPRDEPAILGHRMTLQWWEMQRPMEPYAEHDPLNILELLRVKAATSSHGGLYYTPGGGGYLMNWAYIKKLEASFDEHYCLPNEVVPDDWAISFCMLHHNVTPIDTRDDRQRERFHQYNTSMLYHTAHDDQAYDHAIYETIYEENNWFSDHNGIGWKNGDDCCAPDSITFHYVKPPLMELFHEYYYGKPE